MRVLGAILLFLGFAQLNAQTYLFDAALDGQTITTCSGNFYDEGGLGGTYGSNTNYTVTFCTGTPGQVMRLDLSNLNLDPGWDQLEFFDGPTTASTTMGTIDLDDGSSVTIQTTGECLTIELTTSFVTENAGWEGVLSCIIPCVNPTSAASVTSASLPNDKACLNETFTFDGTGSTPGAGFSIASYAWDFGDGSSGTGTNPTHSYSAAGEYIVQLTVTDNNGCTNSNLVDLGVQVGTVPTFTGTTADVTTCSGNLECLDGVVVPTQYVGNPPPQVTTVVLSLPDGSGVCYDQGITVTGFVGQTITSASDIQSITAELNHTWAGDISIEVECPTGQTVGLFNNDGTWNTTNVSSENFGDAANGTSWAYVFEETGSTIDDWGAANPGATTSTNIPAGNYASEQSFAGFIGCPVNGTWTIRICDLFTSDDGEATSWSLDLNSSVSNASFTPSIGPNCDSSSWAGATPADVAIVTSNSADCNQICVTPVSGSYDYVYTVTDNFGCSFDTTITVTVDPTAPVITNPGNQTACDSYTFPTITGTNLTGGEAYFTGTGGTGTQYNAGQAWTTVGTTTLYIYDVQAGAPNCSNETTFDITINASPTFTVTPTDPTTCGGTDGFLTISGLLNSTAYNVGYTDDGAVVASAPMTSDASGNIVITGLDAGSYTDIIVELNTCSTTDNGPYTLSDPNGPTFTVVGTDPTTCLGTDGFLTISGLTASTSYNVGYTDDGAVVAATPMMSDGSGVITITGLDAGDYSDISVELAGCSTLDNATYTLTDPAGPNFTVAITHPTTCLGTDGELVISGLTASTSYNVSYIDDGASIPAAPMMSDGAGVITITGLDAGTYTDVIVELTGCQTTDNGPFVLTDPTAPTFTVSSTNPTVCLGTDGEINITGLAVSTAYTINYVDDGASVGPLALTSDASGNIDITGLDAGTYTSVEVILNACSTIDPATLTLVDPTAPTFTVASQNPTVCSGTDGELNITGLAVSTAYTINYVDDGATVGPLALTSDASGNIDITGLDAGTYTSVEVILNACSTVDPGSYSLTDPNGPTFTVGTTDPTICTGTDGELNISALVANTNYTVNYLDDGVLVGPLALTSDASGNIDITGLNAGSYTSVEVILTGCSTIDPGTHTLVDPNGPSFTVGTTDPTSCGGTDGELNITGLLLNTAYTINYVDDGAAVGPLALTSDASGNIDITGLDAGTYTSVVVILTGCATTDPGTFTLTDPNGPTFTLASTNPTTCSGTEGTITISGLTASTSYDISYDDDGTPVTLLAEMSDAAGEIVITGLNAGTYTSITASLLGCATTDPATITLVDPNAPTFAVTPANPTTCSGTEGSLTITGLLASTNYNVNYTLNGTPVGVTLMTSDAAGDIVISGLADGTYTDVDVELSGCNTVAPGPFVLTEPTAPVFTVATTSPTTCQGTEGTMTLSGLTAATSYDVTYTWDGAVVGPTNMTADGAGDILITGLEDGSYTDVTVEITGCTTINAGPYTLTDPAGPVFSLTGNNPTACATADGTIEISGLNASTSYDITFSFNTVPAGPTPMMSDGTGLITIPTLLAGTYTDITVDLGGCITIDAGPISLSDPGAPVFTVASTNPTTCSGTDGTITLSGLTPGATYNVDYSFNASLVGVTPMTADGAGDILISGLQDGTYGDIEVELASCRSTAPGTITLTDPAAPSYTVLTNNPTTCNGTDGNITLSGLVAGETYSIEYLMDGATVGPANFTADVSGVVTIGSLEDGSYTNIEVTLNNCMTAEAGPYDLVDPSAPSFTVSLNHPTVCSGADGSIVLGGLTPSTTYDVTYTADGATVGPVNTSSDVAGDITISSLSDATYTNIMVTITGCSTTDAGPYDLNDPSAPGFVVSASNPTTCNGTEGTLTISNLNATTAYTIDYDFNGVAASTVASSSDASGVIIVSGLEDGTYTNVTVTLNACSSTDPATFTLNDPTAPNPIVSATSIDLCGGPLGSLVIDNLASSGTFDITYDDGVTSVGPSSMGASVAGQISVTSLNAGSYTVTVQDPTTMCTATGSTTIVDNRTNPVANAGNPFVINCSNYDPTMGLYPNLVGSGSTGANITYQWAASNGGAIVSGDLGLTPAISAAGRYTITVRDINNGCTSDDFVDITADLVAPVVDAGLDQQITCLNPEVTLDGSGTIEPLNSSIAWTSSAVTGITGSAFSLTTTADLAATYTLTVTNIDNGCSNTATVNVTGDTNPPALNLTSLTGPSACETDADINLTSMVDVPGGVWSAASGGINDPNVGLFDVAVGPNVVPYPVSYEITDPVNLCTSTVTFDVTINPNPVLSVNGDLEGCVGDSVEVTVTGADIYDWRGLGGETFTNAQFYHQVIPGAYNYSVMGTITATGCRSFSDIEITGVNPSVTILGLDPTTTYPYSADLTALGSEVDNYQWFADGNPVSTTDELRHMFGSYGLHSVKLLGTDSISGCADSTILTFELLDPANLFIPSAFTPNNDGKNDIFRIPVTFTQCQLMIFNRWGELVASTNDVSPSWNGTDLIGNMCKQDVYIYKLIATYSTGEEIEKIGKITLLR